MKQSEFDKFAQDYDLTLAQSISFSGECPSFFHEYKVAAAAEIARSRQVLVGQILDFGSGVGNSLPFLCKYFPHSRIFCADVSRQSLEASAARFPGAAEYLEIQGKHLFSDGCFDLVFSACVFHHIPHAEHGDWLGELRRVCRPGGLITVFEHNPWNPLTLKVVRDCPFDRDVNLISAPQFRRCLLRSGWHNAKIMYTLFFPRPLAFLRNAERFLRSVPLGAQYAAIASASSK
jgi:ubiquinone/menaquinone biosynthesis C-methylase UbiE